MSTKTRLTRLEAIRDELEKILEGYKAECAAVIARREKAQNRASSMKRLSDKAAIELDEARWEEKQAESVKDQAYSALSAIREMIGHETFLEERKRKA